MGGIATLCWFQPLGTWVRDGSREQGHIQTSFASQIRPYAFQAEAALPRLPATSYYVFVRSLKRERPALLLPGRSRYICRLPISNTFL